tara:strand:+ start:930 stop:1103 length:174 start_codon:yes stop_codon:yes gene_type:complete
LAFTLSIFSQPFTLELKMSNLENEAQLEYYYEQFREEGHSPQEAEALARQKLEENAQ